MLGLRNDPNAGANKPRFGADDVAGSVSFDFELDD
jgi:hypothetical protein